MNVQPYWLALHACTARILLAGRLHSSNSIGWPPEQLKFYWLAACITQILLADRQHRTNRVSAVSGPMSNSIGWHLMQMDSNWLLQNAFSVLYSYEQNLFYKTEKITHFPAYYRCFDSELLPNKILVQIQIYLIMYKSTNFLDNLAKIINHH